MWSEVLVLPKTDWPGDPEERPTAEIGVVQGAPGKDTLEDMGCRGSEGAGDIGINGAWIAGEMGVDQGMWKHMGYGGTGI